MTINDAKFEVALANSAMNKSELAERAGMTRQRLCVVLNSKKITPKSAGRIAKALGVDVTEIVD